MKHNIRTLFEVLNRYLEPKRSVGLIPMTPMHMELNRMKQELKERQKQLITTRDKLKKWTTSTEWYNGQLALIKEVLADERHS